MGEQGSFDAIADSMKRAAAALRAAGVEVALAGSPAGRGRDGEGALAALEAAGMRGAAPPEEWLVKAWDENDVLVDLIFGPSGVDAHDAIDRAEVLNVLSMELPVMA